MMKIKTNRMMAKFCPNGFEDTDVQIPKEILKILHAGLVFMDGCVYLKKLLSKTSMDEALYGEKNGSEKTGREISINHFHIDFYTDKQWGEVAFTFLHELNKQLRAEFPMQQFRGIFSVNEDSCTIRFHMVRPGEDWIDDDLENYKEDGVCVVDL
jgi:hypothetical protein